MQHVFFASIPLLGFSYQITSWRYYWNVTYKFISKAVYMSFLPRIKARDKLQQESKPIATKFPFARE
jgi:hypothetical protein